MKFSRSLSEDLSKIAIDFGDATTAKPQSIRSKFTKKLV
jgi:hypothetical protein